MTPKNYEEHKYTFAEGKNLFLGNFPLGSKE